MGQYDSARGRTLYFGAVAKPYRIRTIVMPPIADIAMPADLPPLRFDHVARLTDSTGICQHAVYAVPNRHEGYCLDDNARALLLMLIASRHAPSAFAQQHIPTYLSYIHHAQNPNGSFRNFMGYNRVFLDENGTEDAFGRAVWALGYAVACLPGHAYRPLARQLLDNAARQFEHIRSIRSIAAIILGLCHCLEYEPQASRTEEFVTTLG